MSDIRQVTEDFAVAPQIAPDDIAEAAKMGFVLVINNRPDGEAPDQPDSAEMAAWMSTGSSPGRNTPCATPRS